MSDEYPKDPVEDWSWLRMYSAPKTGEASSSLAAPTGLGGVEYKTHSQQYMECKLDGVTLPGKEITETAVRYYKGGRWHQGPLEITTREIICGRFGGICSNQHPECKKLRNSPPPNDQAHPQPVAASVGGTETL